MSTTTLLESRPVPVIRRSPVPGTRCKCGGLITAGGECDQCRRKRQAQLQQPQSGAGPGHRFEEIRIFAGEIPPQRAAGTGTLSAARDDERRDPAPGMADAPRTWHAEVRSVRHPLRVGMLGTTAEPATEDENGVERTAQVGGGGAGGGGGGGAAGGGAGGGAAGAPAGGGCTYSITYANLRTLGCGSGRCGAQIEFDVTGVTATGAGCPADLNGLMLTESVTTDNGCGPGSVTTGAGCPIVSHPPMSRGYGQIHGCTDVYALCGAPAVWPAAGCTERYTQQLFVGGQLAETRTITFVINRSGGGCSGTVTRT